MIDIGSAQAQVDIQWDAWNGTNWQKNDKLNNGVWSFANAPNYEQYSNAFTLNGYNITAVATTTTSGGSDYFFGAPKVAYNVTIPSGAFLTNTFDLVGNDVVKLKNNEAGVSVGGKPVGEVIATSGGNITNYGILRTFPLANNANYQGSSTPAVVALIDGVNTTATTMNGVSAVNHIFNYGVIGDEAYTNTLLYGQNIPNYFNGNEIGIAINSTNGYVYNGKNGIIGGYYAIFTYGSGVIDNYGTITTDGDGIASGYLINNYGVIYNNTNTIGYASVHSYNTVNNYGVMLGQDSNQRAYSVLAEGTSANGQGAGAINLYGGGIVPGLLGFNSAPTFNGEVADYLYTYKDRATNTTLLNTETAFNINPLTDNGQGIFVGPPKDSGGTALGGAIAVMLDHSFSSTNDGLKQSLNLIGQTINGVNYNPVVVGLISGGYAGNANNNNSNPNNILNFNFVGLTSTQNTLLNNAITTSLANPTQGNYGKVALFGVLYQWNGFTAGNINNNSSVLSSYNDPLGLGVAAPGIFINSGGTNSYYTGGKVTTNDTGSTVNNPYNYMSSSAVLVNGNNPNNGNNSSQSNPSGQVTIGNGWSLVVGGPDLSGNYVPEDTPALKSKSPLDKISTYDGVIANHLGDTILNNGNLVLNNTSYALTLPAISGTGELDLSGAAKFTLSAVNTYTGATNIYNGTLALGAGASIANSSGVNLIASGGLAANALPFYGLNPTFDISSAGAPVTVQALSAVRGGTVNLGANTLTIGTATTANLFAGTINGTGGLVIGIPGQTPTQGNGSLTMAGNGNYSGGTTINANATVYVGSTTAFGTGSVINNGTLATGVNSINVPNHTISIPGNYTQGASGILAFTLAGPSVGNDTMIVNGKAVLNGTLMLVKQNGYIPSMVTLLSASQGISGTFSNIINPYSNVIVQYTNNSVILQQLSFSQQLQGNTTASSNQNTIGNYIDAYLAKNNGLANPTPNQQGLANVVGALNNLPTPQAVSSALGQLSPQKVNQLASHAVVQNARYLNNTLNSYLDGRHDFTNSQFEDGAHAAPAMTLSSLFNSNSIASSKAQNFQNTLSTLAYADSQQGQRGTQRQSNPYGTLRATAQPSPAQSLTPAFQAFLRGGFQTDHTAASADVNGSKNNTAHVLLGGDYQIDAHMTAGVLFQYSNTDTSFSGDSSSLKTSANTIGLYGAYVDHGYFLNTMATYSGLNQTSVRSIAFMGQNAIASPKGNSVSLSASGGYDMVVSKEGNAWKFGPRASLQYSLTHFNGYTETGSDAALTVNGDNAQSLRTQLGLGGDYYFEFYNQKYKSLFLMAFEHEFLNHSRGITADFAGLNGGGFTIQTDKPHTNALVLSTGLETRLQSTLDLFVNYSSTLNKNFVSQSAIAGLRYHF